MTEKIIEEITVGYIQAELSNYFFYGIPNFKITDVVKIVIHDPDRYVGGGGLRAGVCCVTLNNGEQYYCDINKYHSRGESHWTKVYIWNGDNQINIDQDSRIPNDFTGMATYPSGTKKYFKDGKLHREDGPAIEWSTGGESWYVNGLKHRNDGPSFKNTNDTIRHWHMDGKVVSPQDVFEELTDEKKDEAIFELDKWQK